MISSSIIETGEILLFYIPYWISSLWPNAKSKNQSTHSRCCLPIRGTSHRRFELGTATTLQNRSGCKSSPHIELPNSRFGQCQYRARISFRSHRATGRCLCHYWSQAGTLYLRSMKLELQRCRQKGKTKRRAPTGTSPQGTQAPVAGCLHSQGEHSSSKHWQD